MEMASAKQLAKAALFQLDDKRLRDDALAILYEKSCGAELLELVLELRGLDALAGALGTSVSRHPAGV